MTTTTASLLSGRTLTTNSIWSVCGIVIPLIVAILAIPHLITNLGSDRFGLLGLIWACIGYFSLFDLGLGRTLTKLVAEKLGESTPSDISNLIATVLILMIAMAIGIALVVGVITPWLVVSVLNVPDALQSEAIHSLWILSLSIPLVIMSSAFVGLLEAHQKFRSLSVIRGGLGLVTFAGPVAVTAWSDSLVLVTGLLAITRAIALALYIGQCRRHVPSWKRVGRFQSNLVSNVCRTGGWMTVSNVVGPLMVYLDRFVIAAVLTLGAVTYYVVPYEIAIRFLVFPVAIAGVLFPAFSTALVSNRVRVGVMFNRTIYVISLIMLPTMGIVILFAPEGLALWLGDDANPQSVDVMQWLAVGVFMNALARFPFSLLQSAGRADLIAIMHLLELPVYFFALYYLLLEFGIVGAAIAWTVRAGVDAVLLFFATIKLVPEAKSGALSALLLMVGAVTILILLAIPAPLVLKLSIAIIGILASVGFLWREIRDLDWMRSLAGSRL